MTEQNTARRVVVAEDESLIRLDIVETLAARQLTDPPEPEQLLLLADRWEIRHGGMSGRTAQQFVKYLAGKEAEAFEFLRLADLGLEP